MKEFGGEETEKANNSMSADDSDFDSEIDTSPVPQSAIDSLTSLIVSDASILCAVCIDHFESQPRTLPEPEPEPESDAVASVARELPCGHVFHSGCIAPWLRRCNSCPLCRCPPYRCHRRRASHVDVALEVAWALSEVSSRAAEALASAQAIWAAATTFVQEESGRQEPIREELSN